MRSPPFEVHAMFRFLVSILMGLSLSAAAEELVVRNAWIREAPPAARSHAAYAELENPSGSPVQLTSVTSETYGMAMIHQTLERNGMATMEHLDTLTIPANGSVHLVPGGLHLMLMSPKRPLKAGDQVTVTLLFAGDQRQDVLFTVRAAP